MTHTQINISVPVARHDDDDDIFTVIPTGNKKKKLYKNKEAKKTGCGQTGR